MNAIMKLTVFPNEINMKAEQKKMHKNSFHSLK